MTLSAGTKIGPYEIVAPLGAGGMGEVYRAKDSRLGRDVAIKVLPASMSRDADRLRRFETEARAVAALNHPNILSLHDIGTYEGVPYLVSECLEGQSLRQELSSGALPQRHAVEYGMQIAQGLASAHDAGIVHRDFKPENIFITRDGRVKILDFGLAKLARPETTSDEGATMDAEVTSAGVVLGTAGYMSPEQVRGESADARSDIFALGTVLYEMLSGNRAFHRDTTAETMTAILKEEPPELSTLSKPVSPAMERIVRRCLEKKPLQRFQSARDLAFNLEGLSGFSSPSGTGVAASKGSSASRIVPVFAGVLLLILVAAASWILARKSANLPLPAYRQLTFDRGLVYSARFAADGRSIYYSASWNGQPLQLYSTTPGSPESRPLSLVNSTLWAVSSSEMAVSVGCMDRYLGLCQGTLGLVPLAGGTPREIAEDALGADWTADGSEMAVIREVSGKYRIEFPRGKVIYESDRTPAYVRISPQGDAVAFAEFYNVDGDAGWVVIVDRKGKEKLRRGPFISVEGVAWSPSGDEVWAAATTTEGWANAILGFGPNKKDRVVLRLPGITRLHDVSRDGQLLISKESWRSGLQFRGQGDAKERDLAWLDYAALHDLSSDGKEIAFDDWGSAAGATGLGYLRKTDGSPAVKLGTWGQAVFSPDGSRVLVFDQSSLGSVKFDILPTGVGEPQSLSPNHMQQAASPGWMPDGKSIYFAGADGQGWRMYLQDDGGGSPRAVTPLISVKRNHSESHLVSPDGKFIFARDVNERGKLYPIDGGEPRSIPGWTPEDMWVTWGTDGQSAYIYDDDKTSARLYRLNLSSGKREQIRTLAPSDADGVTAVLNVRMTADGKTYAYSYDRELSELFVVAGVK
ncbi:MAG TPA: protein kinase [Candidatus Binatia bacterium]|nr:protein kinase [Candidatus Binatia bacterium]